MVRPVPIRRSLLVGLLATILIELARFTEGAPPSDDRTAVIVKRA